MKRYKRFFKENIDFDITNIKGNITNTNFFLYYNDIPSKYIYKMFPKDFKKSINLFYKTLKNFTKYSKNLIKVVDEIDILQKFQGIDLQNPATIKHPYLVRSEIIDSRDIGYIGFQFKYFAYDIRDTDETLVIFTLIPDYFINMGNVIEKNHFTTITLPPIYFIMSSEQGYKKFFSILRKYTYVADIQFIDGTYIRFISTKIIGTNIFGFVIDTTDNKGIANSVIREWDLLPDGKPKDRFVLLLLGYKK